MLKRHACQCHSDAITQALDEEDPGAQSRGPRVSQACLNCAATKLKCSEEKPCLRCTEKGIICQYDAVSATNTAGKSPEQVQDLEDATLMLNRPITQGSTGEAGPPSFLDASENSNEEPIFTQKVKRSEPSGKDGQETLPSKMPRLNSTGGPTPSPSNAPTAVAFEPRLPTPGSTALTISDDNPQDGLYPDAMKDGSLFLPGHDIGRAAPSCRRTSSPVNMWDIFMTTSFDFGTEIPSFGSAEIHAMTPPSPETCDDSDALVMGAEAYRLSFWHWAPITPETHSPKEFALVFCPDMEHENFEVPENVPLGNRHQLLQNADRGRLLNLLITYLPKENAVQIISAFPSLIFLRNLVRLFFRAQRSQAVEFIHPPSFSAGLTPTPLLAAIVASGACSSSVPAVQSMGYAMLDVVFTVIAEMWHGDDPTVRDLHLLQALAIDLTACLWSGDNRRLVLAEAFLQTLTTAARRMGILRARCTRDCCCAVRSSTNSEQQQVEDLWMQWIAHESQRRLAHHIFVLDSELSMMQLTRPLLSCVEMTVHFPHEDELWNAPSATDWKMHQAGIRSGARCFTVAASTRWALTGRYTGKETALRGQEAVCTMYGLWRFVLEYRHTEDLLRGDNEMEKPDMSFFFLGAGPSTFSRQLTKLLDQACQPLDPVVAGRMHLLQAFLAMALRCPLQDVQSFAGRSGEEVGAEIYPSLQEWVITRDARESVRHAAKVLNQVRRLPRGYLQGFYAVAVYHATLVLFGYGVITAARRRREGRGGSPTPVWPATPLPGSTVWLSRRETPEIQRFVTLSEGYPAIGGLGAEDGGRYAYLTHGAEVMNYGVDILHPTPGDSYKEVQSSSLVSSLVHLMGEIGRCARAVGYG
ncbi:hypothetical protein BDV12DRAFT_180286 [Aspergillus spectabilis]